MAGCTPQNQCSLWRVILITPSFFPLSIHLTSAGAPPSLAGALSLLSPHLCGSLGVCARAEGRSPVGGEPLGEQECPGSPVKLVRSVGLWDRVLLVPPPGPGAGSAENQDSKASSEAPGTISGHTHLSVLIPPVTKMYPLKAPSVQRARWRPELHGEMNPTLGLLYNHPPAGFSGDSPFIEERGSYLELQVHRGEMILNL